MKIQKGTKRAGRVTVFVVMILGVLVLSAYFDTLADSYLPQMTPVYAGFVKPQLGLMHYNGTVNDHYTTVYTGNYSGGGERSGRHTGVDIVLGECQATEIRAVAQGEIIIVYDDWVNQNCEPGNPGNCPDPCGNNWPWDWNNPTWGNYVVIRHDDVPPRGYGGRGYGGTAFSIYTHLYNLADDVTVGRKVVRGTVIGYQGSTGYSSAPHLHFQMDRDTDRSQWDQHPYSFGAADEPYIAEIEDHIFSPMYFVQAHLVSTEFLYSGAHAEYYPNRDLSGPPDEYDEIEIDHEWFDQGPLPTPDNFSARWTGSIYFPERGFWDFYVTADDGFKFWFDYTLVADEWEEQIPSVPVTYRYQRRLSPGVYDVMLEYEEYVENATIQLAWQYRSRIVLPLVIRGAVIPGPPYPTPVPTHTPTATSTPVPTATLTPTPSRTPTPTLTPIPTNTSTPTPTPCLLSDLAITLTPESILRVNRNGDFLLAVANNGPCAAMNVTVTDNLPAGLQFFSAYGSGWTCSAAGQAVTCSYPGPLAAGSTITLTVKPLPAAVPLVTNAASVFSAMTDPDPANNRASGFAQVRALPPADFDGDGDSDLAVFRPGDGHWYHQQGWLPVALGQNGDIPVPADYDGDGIAEHAVFRPMSGEWLLCDENSPDTDPCETTTTYLFGQSGDVPVPADYDGDGIADLALFRPAAGLWRVCYMTAEIESETCLSLDYTFGQIGDIAVPADYDGDGRVERAVFRPASGAWVICLATDINTTQCDSTESHTFGQSGDIPVPADYNGDGEADMAVFHLTPSFAVWRICLVDIQSGQCSAQEHTLGKSGDLPVPGDYDGEGEADMAIFRPTGGLWRICIVDIQGGPCTPQDSYFGQEGDLPVEKRPAYPGYPY